MGFHLKAIDLDLLGCHIASVTGESSENLDSLQKSLDTIINWESFTGQGADNIKCYFSEVHSLNIGLLSLLFLTIFERYALFMDSFYKNVDSSKDSHIEETTLNKNSQFFAETKTYAKNISKDVTAAFAPISDILYQPVPIRSLDHWANECINTSSNQKLALQTLESAQSIQLAEIAEMQEAIRALFAALKSSDHVSPSNYVSGCLSALPEIESIITAVDGVIAYHTDNELVISDALVALGDRMQLRYEEAMAEARFWQGVTQIAGGVLMIGIGAVLIIATGGAATPLVVGAFIVAGAFQVAEITEGIQNVYFGLNRNIEDQAFNFIRDTVFAGNQDIYNVAKLTSEAVAFIAIPVSGLGIGARAGRFVGETVAQEAVLQTVVFPVIDSTLGSTPAGQMASLAAGFAIGFATPGGANRGGSAAHGGSPMPHISGFDGTVSHVKVPDVGAVRMKVPDVPPIHGKVPDMPGIKAPDAPAAHVATPDVPVKPYDGIAVVHDGSIGETVVLRDPSINNGDVSTIGSHDGAIVHLDPGEIRYSQTTVNDLDVVVRSMEANGWLGDPIDVVRMPDNAMTSVDNTRLLAANKTGIDVEARVHGYNELLSSKEIGRFKTDKGVPETWGDAVELRIGNQSSAFRKEYPSGTFNPPRAN